VDARWKALVIGGGVTLAVGAAKEAVDATGAFGGDPSWKDFAWDAIGAIAGLAFAWGVDLLIGGVSPAHPALGSPEGQGPDSTRPEGQGPDGTRPEGQGAPASAAVRF
jgi:hypothetical protein